MCWLALHFFLIVTFALRDAASVLPGTSSALPPWSGQLWRWSETVASVILGKWLPEASPVRQTLAVYANGTGIGAGYSYFAPSVPGNCKLLFELHYPDGRLEYDLPHVGGAAAGYRLATLLDYLESFHYVPLRQAILKMLVYPIWQKHPDATTIRAVLAVANLPTAAEFKAGARKSYEPLYAYDFRFRSQSTKPVAP